MKIGLKNASAKKCRRVFWFAAKFTMIIPIKIAESGRSFYWN